jgi:hypothetical protein
MKITVQTSFLSERPRTSAHVRVYPANAVLLADGFLQPADALTCPREREKK